MSQLNPPPIRDSVDQDSRLGLRASWQAWFSQLFKWLQSLGNSVQSLGNSVQSLGNSVSNLVSNYNTAVVWDGVNDRVLGVGQHTSDSFTAQTSMPLHIACGDGQEYEIDMVGTYTPTALITGSLLVPNNVTPSTNSFNLRGVSVSGTTVASVNALSVNYGGFNIELSGNSVYSALIKAYTNTLYKHCFTKSGNSTSTTSGFIDLEIEWNDTTTVWSSLGTITMPNAWTGQIVCRRVA